MEIYIKDKDGKLQETTLSNLIKKAFNKAGFIMDNGGCRDEDHNWIGVIQVDKEEKNQVTINITHKNDGNTIDGIHVYSAPIKRIVDEDESKQII